VLVTGADLRHSVLTNRSVVALGRPDFAHQPAHSPTSPVYTQSSVGHKVILNFLKIYRGMRDYHEGGGVLEVKYYKSAENRWGIVFT
jgi:hypothetical protein